MTVSLASILAEITANWTGACFFPHNCKRPHIGMRGFVQQDLPGEASRVVASFRLSQGDPDGNLREQWEPVEITPFARAAIARERGMIGPVFL